MSQIQGRDVKRIQLPLLALKMEEVATNKKM